MVRIRFDCGMRSSLSQLFLSFLPRELNLQLYSQVLNFCFALMAVKPILKQPLSNPLLCLVCLTFRLFMSL